MQFIYLFQEIDQNVHVLYSAMTLCFQTSPDCSCFASYDKWDNKLFGISDSEAGWMDPQQCLALEVTYSALEDGGFTREKIKGTNTGVYIGKLPQIFKLMSRKPHQTPK